MKKSNRKGFTIVELVIVIAVIAILAAVLIPTFTNLIKKANESSDTQAVRQMNTILSAEGAVEKNNIFDVFDALHEAGLDAKNYKPLVNGTYFFWDDKADRVVYTDGEFNVIYPKGATKEGNWFSLTQTIEAEAPANYSAGEGLTYNVSSGAEMLFVLSKINEGDVKNATIVIPAEGIDMMGASFGIADLTTSLIISCEQDLTDDDIETAVISNAIAIDVSYRGDGETPGHDGQYAVGLFGEINAALTIENVTFKNIHVKNTHGSGVGILVGLNEGAGTLTLKNVSIEDSSVIGHRNTGALVGNNSGKVSIDTFTLKNVEVAAVGGRSGLIFGFANKDGKANLTTALETAVIAVENCSYTIYQCEQNAGGINGNIINSWAYDGNGVKKDQNGLYYIANSLISVDSTGETTGNALFKNITGWN